MKSKDIRGLVILIIILLMALFLVLFYSSFFSKKEVGEIKIYEEIEEETEMGNENLPVFDDPIGNALVSGENESVMSLDLNGLEMGTISPLISEFTNLEEILLNFNSLTKIPEEIFDLKKIKSIHLEYNLLTEISPKIENLSNLERLYLGGNNLSTLPVEIKNLKNLKELTLYDNDFSEKEMERIKEMLPNVKIFFEYPVIVEE
jgi:Leucine-rich repeat (LRR) protein